MRSEHMERVAQLHSYGIYGQVEHTRGEWGGEAGLVARLYSRDYWDSDSASSAAIVHSCQDPLASCVRRRPAEKAVRDVECHHQYYERRG